MLPSQGFGDFDRRQHRSPSPMASTNIVSNIHGGGYGGWNGLHQEVFSSIESCLYIGFFRCDFSIKPNS